jgi:hypothetical protein
MLTIASISKSLAFLLDLLIVMSSLTILMVKPANAQTIPKPSVPEFTAKFVDHSYIVSASTTVDPYTGKEITHQSYTF